MVVGCLHPVRPAEVRLRTHPRVTGRMPCRRFRDGFGPLGYAEAVVRGSGVLGALRSRW